MAVRFNASGEALARARLAGARTIMGWFRIVTDRNAVSTLLVAGDRRILVTGTNGTTLRFYDGVSYYSGTDLTVGTWYHLTLTIADDSYGTCIAYVNGVEDINRAFAGATDSGSTMVLGNNGIDQRLDGNIAHVKMWSAVLSVDEIQQEMHSVVPVRTANLDSWYPLDLHSDMVDWSGNGNTLTAYGTLTTEDNPPVSWGGAIVFAPAVPASGPASQNAGVGVAEARAGGMAVSASPGGIIVAVGQVAQTVAGYAVAALPGGVTVTPGQAVATIEGYTPATVQSQNIGVGSADAAIAGYAIGAAPGAISAIVGQAVAGIEGRAIAAAPGEISVAAGQALATFEGYAVTAQNVETAQSVSVGQAAATIDAYAPTAQPGAVTVGVGGAVATIEGYAPNHTRTLTVGVGAAEAATETYPIAGEFGVITVSVGMAEAAAENYAPAAAPGAIAVAVGQALAHIEAYALLPGEPGIAGFVVISDFISDRVVIGDYAPDGVIVLDTIRDTVSVRDA